MSNWPDIIDQIQQNTGLTIDSRHLSPVTGGCINTAYLLGIGKQQVFIKTNCRNRLKMFEAEAEGLCQIANARAVRVPEVLCTGVSEDTAFIAMQAIQFSAPVTSSYRNFGQQLAALHHHRESRYGASLDNTIGSTPQTNSWSDDWCQFWRDHRLGFQLDLARRNHAPAALIDDGLRLRDECKSLFKHKPKASCLHGDLWQGNWAFDHTGLAVIFDPAHYFGDRETDIAMTTLFGRAPVDFYAAYHSAYKLDDGYSVRETFYNIYHILNHYNLFGGGYATQAHNMVQNVLSELR